MKNLIDVGKEIKKYVNYFNSNDEYINSVELNQNTLSFLREKGIYSFSDNFSKDIPIIINNSLTDNEIKFNREKIIKPTEYIPYEEKRLGGLNESNRFIK